MDVHANVYYNKIVAKEKQYHEEAMKKPFLLRGAKR